MTGSELAALELMVRGDGFNAGDALDLIAEVKRLKAKLRTVQTFSLTRVIEAAELRGRAMPDGVISDAAVEVCDRIAADVRSVITVETEADPATGNHLVRAWLNVLP